MSKFQIDLNNYPDLLNLFNNNQKEFAAIVSPMLQFINDSVKDGRTKTSLDIYKEEYPQLVKKIMNAFFNSEGIVRKHSNEAEQEGLRGLGLNIHPLAIFTNDTPVYNAKGENVSPFSYLSKDDFNIENWLYSLFYGARFVSHQELAEYLTLGEYDLIDVLKARNIEQLQHLQPELDKQKEKGIPVGKLKAGTGELDV